MIVPGVDFSPNLWEFHEHPETKAKAILENLTARHRMLVIAVTYNRAFVLVNQLLGYVNIFMVEKVK